MNRSETVIRPEISYREPIEHLRQHFGKNRQETMANEKVRSKMGPRNFGWRLK
jgi:hypothetical protein